MSACADCLRRAYLVALLAPRIAALLAGERSRRRSGLLALPDRELIGAVAGREAAASATRFLERFDERAARAELRAARVEAICGHEKRFPDGLAHLADRPAALFAVGRVERLQVLARGPAVTIVGARRASPYGLEMARSLGRAVGAAGLPVVSGLALGIDGSAHRGCLEGEGLAIAVLAGGPDVPYPPRHRGLYKRVAQKGVVLSEMPPRRRAYRWSFPARNRLMAALSAMTVVVEAAAPSGSLITAELAEDLGRSVGAVPGRANATVARGSNALLRSGAAVVRSAADVLDEVLGAGAWEQRLQRGDSAGGDPETGPPSARRGAPARPAAAAARASPEIGPVAVEPAAAEALEVEPKRSERGPAKAASPEPALDAALRRVLEAVEGGHGVDGVARSAGLSPARARAALGRLEAMGLVVRTGLDGFERRVGP